MSKTPTPKPEINVLDDVGLQLNPESITADRQLAAIASDEAFMNEVLQVYVHEPQDPEAPTQFILNVNGTNQPVFCGVTTPLKRKYVEVLARLKETKYSQRQQDLANPEHSNALVPRSIQVHPFQVQHDPSGARGDKWLRQILSERA